MIQLGQLSLFVMAQLASRLPFQSAYVPLHWTYQLNSFRKKTPEEKKEERIGERKEGAVEGKKWNKECSNNHIIHLNAEANYRDKCDFLFWGGSLWGNQRRASERARVTEEMLHMEIWSLNARETTAEAMWRSRDRQRKGRKDEKIKRGWRLLLLKS